MSDTFKDIFYKHYPSVVRKLTLLVQDEGVAEDLAQEVFLRLYRNPPNELEAVGAWLHRVLTRVGYDYLNKRTRERALIQKQEQLVIGDENRALSNEDVTLRKMEQKEVRDWLDQLPERDRRLLMLKYSGYSYNEIAEKLRVRRPLVGTMLLRATEKLRKQAELNMRNQYE
ncbi:sigma-70 family RNA polymerase sigma factor [Paenibacillus alkalitolerans]|uniref:sigma-70 family RNA polymerase sigma factor n=1 Tax=Paenibacillus alkalitolerans TaxID=2799335 RepID=UPI0018F5AC94|nr:sigma-70 family RNA polymerase sigma factor [Paenibacillus alkalitolerans]